MIEVIEEKEKEEVQAQEQEKQKQEEKQVPQTQQEKQEEKPIVIEGRKKIDVVRELLEKGYSPTEIAELTGYDKNYVYVTCSKLKKSQKSKELEAEKIGIEIEKKTIPKPKPRVKVEERILTEDELKQLFLSVNPMFRQFGLEEVSEAEASLLANLWRPYATISGDIGLALAVGTTSLVFGGRILKKVIDSRRKEERKEQKQIEQVEEKIISGGDGKSWFERRRGSV
ncbi:MAG: hypothetical protein QW763_02790 [Archaeoglobaceae archaeon]